MKQNILTLSLTGAVAAMVLNFGWILTHAILWGVALGDKLWA